MANTSLRLIAAQEKHIKLLQEKLDKLREEQIYRFTSTPGWPLFVLRNSSTYNRRIISNTASGYLNWALTCKVSIEIEDNNVYIICSGVNAHIKTNSISIDIFDKFVENTDYDYIVDYATSHFWSSAADRNLWNSKYYKGSEGYNSMILYSFCIKNVIGFFEGKQPILSDEAPF